MKLIQEGTCLPLYVATSSAKPPIHRSRLLSSAICNLHKMRQPISSLAFSVGRSLTRISYSKLLTVQSNSQVHHVFQVDPRAEDRSLLGEVANNNRKPAIPTLLHMMDVLLAKSGPVTLQCIELKGLASWHE
jgi:hypothetical protein